MQLLKLTKKSDKLSFWLNAEQIVGIYNSGANPNGCTVLTTCGSSHELVESAGDIAAATGGAICIADDSAPPPADHTS